MVTHAPKGIVEVASRRMRLQVPTDAETVEAVAKVLREERPNLSHSQADADALAIIKGVNEALASMPVPAKEAQAVKDAWVNPDPLGKGEQYCFAELNPATGGMSCSNCELVWEPGQPFSCARLQGE